MVKNKQGKKLIKEEPKITEKRESLNNKELKAIASDISENTYSEEIRDNSDTFYKTVVKELMSPDNIETKTEYLNPAENFNGARLTFLAKYVNMPFLEEFVGIFERKRVSLERKGRKEIIMALLERHKEEQETRMSGMRSFFGMG